MMYFTSKQHQERYEQAVSAFAFQMDAEQQSLIYLATSDVLKNVGLIEELRPGGLTANTETRRLNKLSSGEKRLAKLALHLFNSLNKCDSIVDIISCLDEENRMLFIQALRIRARV